jgi:2-(1,2-epoxy-1,2-dihydrophenyl)acetyl-CoA isomerase
MLDIRIDGAVALLTLQRPERFNALNLELIGALDRALDELTQRDAVRALVLSGAGRAFCSGADLAADSANGVGGDYAEVQRMAAPQAAQAHRAIGDATRDALLQHFHPLILKIHRCPKPVVCAVNGTAAGGGVGLALACDIVIAARSARFVQVFAPRLGLVPDCGISWQLPRRVGDARGLALALLGDAVDAEQAERIGLIWRAVDDAELAPEALRIARRLAANPGHVNALVKDLLRQGATQDLAAQLDLEARLQGVCGATPAFVEGVLAFQHKREPRFHDAPPTPGLSAPAY